MPLSVRFVPTENEKMSLIPETITIRRPTKSSDGAGGKVSTFQNLGTAQGTRNFYSSKRGTRQEEGPGVATQQLRLFVFRRPFVESEPGIVAGIKVNYQLQTDDGLLHKVLTVRPYDSNVQIDTEVFNANA